jgi:signal peptide peptidase SppA
MGPWLIRPEVGRALVTEHAAGRLRTSRPLSITGPMAVTEPGDNPDVQELLYTKDETGVGVINITGVMVKGESSFAGVTNTQRTRRAVRTALRDADVETMVYIVDSPGGMAAGTPELAEDIRKAGLKKPSWAHVDDDAGSAAYYAASQAGKIAAQATSWIGSIGTLIVLYDQSEQFTAEGIKTFVVSTGAYKGAFASGAEIPKEHLEYAQHIVDTHGEFFIQAVAAGRKAAGMTLKDVRAAADGRMYTAAEAKDMGLIDAVQRLDDTIAEARAAAAAIREARSPGGTPRLDRARRKARAAAADAQ